jgi:hypothetical protein
MGSASMLPRGIGHSKAECESKTKARFCQVIPAQNQPSTIITANVRYGCTNLLLRALQVGEEERSANETAE